MRSNVAEVVLHVCAVCICAHDLSGHGLIPEACALVSVGIGAAYAAISGTAGLGDRMVNWALPRDRADTGLIFGCCGFACLWASVLCQAPQSESARLQLWGGICNAGILLSGCLPIRTTSAAAMIVAAFSTNSAGISQTIAGVLCQVFPLVLGFVIARHTALRLLPRCFTFGEAAFIAQGVSSVGICGMAATVRTWQVARSRWTFGLEWSHQNSVLTILVAINVAMWLTAGSIVMLLLLTRRVASKTPAVTKAVIVYGWAILLLTSVFEPWISRLLGVSCLSLGA